MNQDRFEGVVELLDPGAEVQSITRLTGGVSADVYRLDIMTAGAGVNSVVLRVHGKTHSGHPAKLEHQLLTAIHATGFVVPEPLLVDDSCTILPDPYLVTRFVQGSTEIPAVQAFEYIDLMAAMLAAIHDLPATHFPNLPDRSDPLPEVFEFLPEGTEWRALRAYLQALVGTGYQGKPKLLHGDFWPENLLWQEGAIVSVLDWEDAATGDPLSDVATARVELRYKFGKAAMHRFTESYLKHQAIDIERLALWQVYVAAAAQKHMGQWRLEPEVEAHMRKEALASIREAADELMGPSVT